MSAGGGQRWYEGLEAVQVVGHSAYGGGVPVILACMRVTAELGMHPVLLATHPDVVAAAEKAGYEVWRFPGIVREPRPVRDLFAALRLSVALRRRDVRIVHTHTSKGGLVGRLAAKLAGCRVVIHHTHGFYYAALPPGPRRWAMRTLETLFARLDDAQVFVNSGQAAEAEREGVVPRGRSRVVFNSAVDPLAAGVPDRSAMRARLGVPEGAALIGTVGRVAFEAKGLDDGARAVALVMERVPSAWWAVVGKGEDERRLADLVRELRIADRTVLAGHVDGAAGLHPAFDVTFAPSRREGQSVAVIEAMACSAAIVATRIAGTADLIEDGVGGVVVEVGDAEAMARELARVLGDASLAASLGRAARLRYEHLFTPEAFADRMRGVYLEILEAKAP